MLTSAHNFFYLSVDPAGFVSLDKPPLAFWIQAASAKVFGFHGLSLLLPEALAGIASVYVLYRLVRRTHGQWPGLLAALTLAVTPISVVTNRNNAPDALLILVLLLAAWALLRVVEENSRRWLFVTAVLVGVAFNIKMLQILLVVPAFAVLYLIAAPSHWRTRLLNAGGAILVVLLVSVPWVMAVELTPPDQRPYVGGSTNNTVSDLIFGYNGVARLWGDDFTYYSGAPSPVRLFNDKLGGQASWLLLFALIGLIAAAWQLRQSNADTSARRNVVILWTAWLIVPLIYFSISTFFHRYYLAMLAPTIAALVGIGADTLWTVWHTGGRQRALVVLALILCAGTHAVILLPFPNWILWSASSRRWCCYSRGAPGVRVNHGSALPLP
jgi:4-amino-4-deoxy-L-arabinose transferase-like glycosyltransferase